MFNESILGDDFAHELHKKHENVVLKSHRKTKLYLYTIHPFPNNLIYCVSDKILIIYTG